MKKTTTLKVKNQIRPSTSPSIPTNSTNHHLSSVSSILITNSPPLPNTITTTTTPTTTTTTNDHHYLKVTFDTITFDFLSILKLISKSSPHQSRPKFNSIIQFLSTLSLNDQFTISSPSKPKQLIKPLDKLLNLIDSIQPHLKSNIDRSLVKAIGDLLYFLQIIYHSNLSQSNFHLVNFWKQIHHHSQHINQLVEEINLLQPKMLHPYQQIPNRPTTFDEKYQGDLDNILSAIDRLYTNSPQLSNQRAQLKHPSKDLLSLDLVISSIERTTARRLDTQRASLPTLVSQGVAAMGWCVESRSSTLEEEGPAELEFLDRLERAGSRRYTNQCSRIPPIEQQPSLMSLYTQSMRETDAMETILTKTGEGRMSNQDAILRKNRPISLATSTLTRSVVELETATIDDDDLTSDSIGLLQEGQFPAPPTRETHRSQSMPNIFKKNKTHSTPPPKRNLFGKKSSNPPNSTTSNPRDSVEDPFRMPSLTDYPLTSFLDDITNQDHDHTSNDQAASPAGGSHDRETGSNLLGNRSSSKNRDHERLAMAA